MSEYRLRQRPLLLLVLFVSVLLLVMLCWLHGWVVSPLSPVSCPPPSPLSSLRELVPYSRLDPRCGLVSVLHTLYTVEEETGDTLVISPTLQEKVEDWLGGDTQLLTELLDQTVVQVTCLLSGETTHYNPLRARRPRPAGGREAGRVWAEEEVRRTRQGCDFCDAGNMTGEESWGRIVSPGCSTAANLFKVAGPNNGLILSTSHSIFDIGLVEWRQILHCATLWYHKVHSTDKQLIFPMLVQDMFPKAGASKVHPHLHTWLGRTAYSGHFASMLRSASSYISRTGRDYWRDLLDLHMDLGLGVRHGQATAIIPLTSRRDHEVMIVSDSMCEDTITLLAAVMEAYHEDLGVFCHSLGVALPPLIPQPRHSSLPAIVRIGSRGLCTNTQSDVSSLDLYAFYSVNVNPLQTIKALTAALERVKLSK